MMDALRKNFRGAVVIGAGRGETFLICLFGILLVGSTLLWSSPEYREGHLLLASMAAVCFSKKMLWPLLPGMGWQGVLVATGLAVMHAASWLGGLWHEEDLLTPSTRGLAGVLGVVGLAVFVVLLLEARWKGLAKWTGLGLLAVLLVGSYVGFFVGIERFFTIGRYAFQFDQLRMALVWPTRLLTWPLGQLAWEHTNYAAFYFALALAMTLEHLAVRVRGRGWWVLSLLLGAAVFLTASRNGWLMMATALLLVLVGRKPAFAIKTLGLLAGGVLLGFVCLNTRLALIPPAVEDPTVRFETHGAALLERGSAGRLAIYKLVWEEVENAPFCGQGLWSVGRWVGPLEHEHSVFMATLRGGGVIGLAGHFLVIAGGGWAALLLMKRGIRWPAVLFFTTVVGMLFERSSVVALTGNFEFIAHWVAVILPLVLTAKLAEKSQGNPKPQGKVPC